HVVAQILLYGSVPLVNQWIPVIAGDATEGWRDIQREHIRREAARHAARKERIRIERSEAVTIQLDGFVEGNGFPAVRVTALVLFTAIEHTVTEAHHSRWTQLIGDTDARREVQVVGGDQVLVGAAAAHVDERQRGVEARWQRSVLIFAFRNVKRVGLRIEAR